MTSVKFTIAHYYLLLLLATVATGSVADVDIEHQIAIVSGDNDETVTGRARTDNGGYRSTSSIIAADNNVEHQAAIVGGDEMVEKGGSRGGSRPSGRRPSGSRPSSPW
eukprot:CAMPEP_0172304308 /NCGR_PEP_ID=MMETSP1058-20130122/5730_1 /TAXON_ID=83371 /ORGANISM="Detonula confervacea, Strain CCMP 353" /LENGTH=107 /DNA_ID=CAMNT_0013015479 /DNA_START=39 /DNA_END=359 /DNA_ORIENTATION=+